MKHWCFSTHWYVFRSMHVSLSLEPEKALSAQLCSNGSMLLWTPWWSLDPHTPTVLKAAEGTPLLEFYFSFPSLTWKKTHCQMVRCPKRANLHGFFFEEHFSSFFLKSLWDSDMKEGFTETSSPGTFLTEEFHILTLSGFPHAEALFFVAYLVTMPTCPCG